MLQDFFHEGEPIIREGTTGDTFFLINKGEVSISFFENRIQNLLDSLRKILFPSTWENKETFN